MKSIIIKLFLVAVLSTGIISLTACSPDKKKTEDCCLSSVRAISTINLQEGIGKSNLAFVECC